jgi:toxin ParE1/3/4
MTRYTRTARAQQDLERHAERIAQDRPNAALRFLEAAEQTFQQLADFPEIGVHCRFESGPLKPLRFMQIADFRNYLVFYQPSPHGIHIIRVLHGARDIERLLSE